MNPKPKPPLPGGEHVQFIDTGPQGVSPNATRVNLIPVGDGGPGTLLPRVNHKKRKPVLLSKEEIAGLPRWCQIAFAARCARRVLPLLRDSTSNAGTALVTAVEQSAAQGRLEKRAIVTAMRELEASRTGLVPSASYAAIAAFAAARAEGCEAAKAAVAAMKELAATTTSLHIRFPRRDFERLARLAHQNTWNDDTPVPPEVFGPMWPLDREPEWARKTEEP